MTPKYKLAICKLFKNSYKSFQWSVMLSPKSTCQSEMGGISWISNALASCTLNLVVLPYGLKTWWFFLMVTLNTMRNTQ